MADSATADEWTAGSNAGWASDQWNAAGTVISGIGSPTAPLININLLIPLVKEIPDNYTLFLKFAYAVDKSSDTPPVIHIKPFKWTCGEVAGDGSMSLVELGAEDSFTLSEINGTWYVCGEASWPVVGDILEDQKVTFGWRTDPTSDIWNNVGAGTWKAWSELIA